MVFCGHCGYQLAPGNTVCPRCGTPVDPDMDLTMDNPEPDNPTIASSLMHAPTRAQPGVRPPGTGNRLTPAQQEPLILGPGGNTYDPNAPIVNDPTNMMGATTYAMPEQAPPANPNMGASYPGYGQQNFGNYPQPAGSYSGYMPPVGYQPQADQYEAMRAEIAARNRTGRIVGLLLILLGLLLIIGAMVLYVVGHTGTASVWHTIPLARAMISNHIS